MKTCNICKEPKPVTEFNKNKTKRDGLQNFCRECGKRRSQKYYEENRKSHIRNVRKNNIKHIAEMRELTNSLKSQCCVCGESEKVCLDWHHLNPSEKDFNIGMAVSKNLSKKKILAEIKKCICVCSNCHRKIHAGIIESPQQCSRLRPTS